MCLTVASDKIPKTVVPLRHGRIVWACRFLGHLSLRARERASSLVPRYVCKVRTLSLTFSAISAALISPGGIAPGGWLRRAAVRDGVPASAARLLAQIASETLFFFVGKRIAKMLY